MEFVNLCKYPASVTLFGEVWETVDVGEKYAYVNNFGTVSVNRKPHQRLGAYTGEGFPVPSEGVIYLAPSEVAEILKRADVIGIPRPAPAPAPAPAP